MMWFFFGEKRRTELVADVWIDKERTLSIHTCAHAML